MKWRIWTKHKMGLSQSITEIQFLKIEYYKHSEPVLLSEKELLDKRQHATMSAVEEERFLQLHSLFSKYGETDDIPSQLMTADADRKLDSIIEKLSKLVDRKED